MRRRVEPGRLPPPRRRAAEDAEALAELADLVHGRGAFDITVTDEYLQGAVVGLEPEIVERLRRGEFACRAYLDMHGLTAEEARRETGDFIAAAIRAGHRCVLIVHGRGLNSKHQRPVLKDRLKAWLSRGALARSVLAFTTARPCDGGAGALYVLLRRPRRRKRPIKVVEGPG